MSIVGRIRGPGSNGLGYDTTAEQATAGCDLAGRTWLLTGCNSGIGKETLRVLSLRGAHVIAAARTVQKAEQALAEAGASGTPVACELSEPDSVRACVSAVQQLAPLDGILCNAGIMALPERTVRHGLELQFLTNHMGHFLLVTGLLDRLADDGRVVVVASTAHRRASPKAGVDLDDLSSERRYKPWEAYGRSKLANILFARQLSRRFGSSSRTANSLHPGVINTGLTRHMPGVARHGWAAMEHLGMKSIAQGAATQCYLAASPAVAGTTGQYFADCNPARTSRWGTDDDLAQRLWEKSAELARRL